MKSEKIILSFIAVVIGILVAGVTFYLYQAAKTVPSSKIGLVAINTPTPSFPQSVFLTIDTPKDEDVVSTKTVTVSGKTATNATIAIQTESNDQVIQPASNGNFSATIAIDSGANQLQITAIAPDGQETMIKRTITYSTEQF